MGTRQVLGLLRFPAFLLVWSAGIVIAMGTFLPALPADASLVQRPLVVYAELPEVPSTGDMAALKRDLHALLEQGDLADGAWQPRPTAAALLDVIGSEGELDREQVSSPEVHPADSGHLALPVRPVVSAGVSIADTHAAEVRVPAPVIEPVVHVPAPEAVSTMRSAQIPVASTIADSKTPVTATQARFDPLATIKQAAREALGAGERRAAHQLLMESVTDGAMDVEYLGLLAAAALAAGRHGEAHVVYERLLGLQPDNERWLAGLALCQEQLGLDSTQVYQALAAQTADGSPLNALALRKLGSVG